MTRSNAELVIEELTLEAGRVADVALESAFRILMSNTLLAQGAGGFECPRSIATARLRGDVEAFHCQSAVGQCCFPTDLDGSLVCKYSIPRQMGNPPFLLVLPAPGHAQSDQSVLLACFAFVGCASFPFGVACSTCFFCGCSGTNASA